MTISRSPYQLDLDLGVPDRGEAPHRVVQGIEIVTATAKPESPAPTEHLVEAICDHMDKMKMYMEMPAPPVADSSLPKPEITKTGKSQKILDYECQQYLVKEGETASEVWITKGLGTFQMFRMAGRGRNSNAQAWQKMVGSEGGFPLLASTKNGDAEISKMMATKIEKKSHDDALFKIPDGYKRFDASMMGGPR